MLFPIYAIALEENTYTGSCLARAISERASDIIDININKKHSSRMRTDRAVTSMSSGRVVMRPIVDGMTQACENITFPCGW